MKLISAFLFVSAFQSQVWALGANSQVFEFTNRTKADTSLIFATPKGKGDADIDSISGYFAICSANVKDKRQLRQPITCLSILDGYRIKLANGRLFRYRFVNHNNPKSPGPDYTEDFIEIDQAQTQLQPPEYLHPSQMNTLRNLISLMSQQKPLYLAFDMDAGKWAYGLNKDSLIPLK